MLDGVTLLQADGAGALELGDDAADGFRRTEFGADFAHCAVVTPDQNLVFMRGAYTEVQPLQLELFSAHRSLPM